MKVLYVDMDGTIAEYLKVSVEEMAREGYFRNLPEMHNVLKAIKLLMHEDIEIRILSSVFNDNHSVKEKTEWLHEKFPEMKDEKMIFVPFGMKKCECAEEGSFLLDDFSPNLHEWESIGIGIKIYNGINGNHGSWHGYSVRSDMEPEKLYKQLKGILMTN